MLTKKLDFTLDEKTGRVYISSGFSPEQLSSELPTDQKNEPESHLARLMSDWEPLSNMRDSRVLIVSPKDESLGKLLAQNGVEVDALYEWQEFKSVSRLEQFPTLVELLGKSWPNLYGQYDFVIARHLVEHIFDLDHFSKQVERALRPGGSLVIEVPDISQQFRSYDYTAIWEEHQSYFVPNSLSATMRQSGWSVISEFLDTVDSEQILIMAFQQDSESRNTPGPAPTAEFIANVCRYFEQIPKDNKRLKSYLLSNKISSVMCLGANHATAMFLNLLWEPTTDIYVVDDDANKQGDVISRFQVPVLSLNRCSEGSRSLVLCGINRSRSEGLITRVKKKYGANQRIVYISEISAFLDENE